jgi:hypothetical protein
MKIELRQRDKRALLLLAGALAMYLVVMEAALPIYDYLSAAPAIVQEKSEQLQKYRRALNRKGRYQQLIPAARAQATTAERILIQGDTASSASTELQGLIETIAKDANINLAQRSVSGPKKVDEFYNEVSMALVFEATPSQLVTFLTGIRTSPKFLTVRTLQMTPVQQPTEAPKTGEFRKTVRVSATVSALLTPVKAG